MTKYEIYRKEAHERLSKTGHYYFDEALLIKAAESSAKRRLAREAKKQFHQTALFGLGGTQKQGDL